MSAGEKGRKRLQPKMKRGAFRWQFVIWSLWTVLQLVSVIMQLASATVWDSRDYWSLIALIFGVAGLVYLLYVRHHDGRFWEEEEAARADWDRRGRAL
ncbi:hypothetical protein J2S89_000592 [Arthrobacter bambusae]|nr:hypothetical protein [Arthrobacter bambusae]MDQ0096422.1 hypothetical protein [Arthrobacter bambusae]